MTMWETYNYTIIDADSLIYKVCYDATSDVPVIDIYKKLDEIINEILNKTNADYYTGYLSKGATFRHLFKYKSQSGRGYKGNRKSSKPLYFYDIFDYLVTEWKFISSEGSWLEADDLCLIAYNYGIHNDYASTISSPDKDLRCFRSNIYNYNTGIFYYGYTDLFWKSMLTGDSSDGISGVPGIGEQKANKIMEESENLPHIVLDTYHRYFSEPMAIRKFYQNYTLLKLIESPEEYETILTDMGYDVSSQGIHEFINIYKINE